MANHSTAGIQTSDVDATIRTDHTLWHGNTSDTDISGGGVITPTNDFFGDPIFAGGSNPIYAYHIGSGSAAFNNGIDVGLVTDIDGDSRPLLGGYDIGADEYTGVILPPTSIIISTPASGTIQHSALFTGTVGPPTATVPITYVWQIANEAPITQTGNLVDEVYLTSNLTGTQPITVTAFNSAGTVSTTGAITLTVPQAASLPFSDDFETGTLSADWLIQRTTQAQVQVSSAYPYSGTQSVLLSKVVSDSTDSTAAMILTLDFVGEPSAVLNFWWREFNDENDPEDGVFISNDYGANWYQVLSFNNGPQVYQREFIDLAAAAAANGLTFNDHFQIKFQFRDNESIPHDGIAIDEVQVTNAQAISSVAISGPTTGLSQVPQTFTATVSPLNTTPPITYSWQAANQTTAVTQTTSLTDSVTFNWNTTGVQTITLTAENAISTVTSTHLITITALPDLQVTNISAITTAFAGDAIPITWTVQNKGTGPTIGSSWSDRIYLSTDDTLSTTVDTTLSTVSHTGVLTASEAYTSTTNVILPQGISGNYYLFVATDVNNEIAEPSAEDNNSSTEWPIYVQFTITPTQVSGDMVLNWPNVTENINGAITVDHYEVWRSTEPYFSFTTSPPYHDFINNGYSTYCSCSR